jgi:hypothetical protein
MGTYLDTVTLDESIWGGDDSAGGFDLESRQKFSTIAKLIKGKDLRDSDRDFFFTSVGRWDHHGSMIENLDEQAGALNYGLDLFVKQLKADGLFDDVTVVIASEFGRTLTPNRYEAVTGRVAFQKKILVCELHSLSCAELNLNVQSRGIGPWLGGPLCNIGRLGERGESSRTVPV